MPISIGSRPRERPGILTAAFVRPIREKRNEMMTDVTQTGEQTEQDPLNVEPVNGLLASAPVCESRRSAARGEGQRRS